MTVNLYEYRAQAQAAVQAPDQSMATDVLVAALVGEFPNLAEGDDQRLAEEVSAWPRDESVAFCRRHGFDILAPNGERVNLWLPLAVVLRRRERGAAL